MKAFDVTSSNRKIPSVGERKATRRLKPPGPNCAQNAAVVLSSGKDNFVVDRDQAEVLKFSFQCKEYFF